MSEQEPQSIEDLVNQKGRAAADSIIRRHQRYLEENPERLHWSTERIKAAAKKEQRIAEFFARQNLTTGKNSSETIDSSGS